MCLTQKRRVYKKSVSVSKKNGGHGPVINLKSLNNFLPYQYFKMEAVHLVKDLLQQNDYMSKTNLKDVYFCIPLHRRALPTFIRFQWKGSLYEFLCLCFGLGPAPRIFTKLMEIPIAVLLRLKI